MDDEMNSRFVGRRITAIEHVKEGRIEGWKIIVEGERFLFFSKKQSTLHVSPIDCAHCENEIKKGDLLVKIIEDLYGNKNKK